MATNRITLESPLDADERRQIDVFCQARPDVPALAGFLTRTFSLAITCDPDIVQGFKQDSSHLPGNANGLCRARTEKDCAVVAHACHRAGIPLTVSGGRSNLTGSATPESGVILSVAGMLQPDVSIDPDGQTVRAPVGMILEDLRNCVLADTAGRLCFPVDPTSRKDATVGGAISCNASGFTPGEAGAMRDWLLAVDFVLPNGLVCRIRRGENVTTDGRFLLTHGSEQWTVPVPRYRRPAIKNAAGPYSNPAGTMDFIDLVIGSEGIFGIVTACTLKLLARPVDQLDLFFSLPDEAAALRVLEHVRREWPGGLGTLSAFEYFGPHCREYMNHGPELFYSDDPVAIYVQQPLDGAGPDAAMETWLEILSRPEFGINEDAIRLFDTDRTRAIFLDARHSIPANSLEVVQRRGTHTIMTDTVVPPAAFGEFLSFTHGVLRADAMDYLAFGHLGDCHLHFMILPTKEQLATGLRAYDAIVAKAAALGGVYSGEHGTGKRKRGDFLKCYGPDAVEQVRACKQALDPQFLLNRGNVIE